MGVTGRDGVTTAMRRHKHIRPGRCFWAARRHAAAGSGGDSSLATAAVGLPLTVHDEDSEPRSVTVPGSGFENLNDS
jgi:hypothetical protein